MTLCVAACTPGAPAPVADTSEPEAPAESATVVATPAPLAGTQWRLLELQSMDDAQGSTRPEDPSRFTLQFGGDGTASLQLDCNRAHGSWTSEPAADGVSGSLRFGPMAATRALCPPPNLDEKVQAQLPMVRSYLLRDGKLSLSLEADGGILIWKPLEAAATPVAAAADPTLEAAILAAVGSSYDKAMVELSGGQLARYAAHRIDLDGDGKDEVLVYLLGGNFCGTGGCTMLLLVPAADGYRLVQQFPITQTPVLAAPERSHGWRDLLRHEAGGGAKSSFVRHSFNGKTYVQGKRTAGNETPPGDVVFAADLDFAQGLPLAPAR